MNKKLFILSLISALVFCFLFSMLSFSASCEEMYKNIVRVRIIANSDSKEDQTLKIKVRDAVLEASSEILEDNDSYDDVILKANENLDVFLNAARNVVLENGYDYTVAAEIREELFDTRIYENFTLPSGNYETLVITIGEGKGENWWCVMFPSVCVGACSGKLEDSISQSSAEKAYNPEKYVAKFKIIEIYESAKNFFTKS